MLLGKCFAITQYSFCLIINKHHADQIDFLGGDTKNKQETRSPKRFRDESVVLQKKKKNKELDNGNHKCL